MLRKVLGIVAAGMFSIAAHAGIKSIDVDPTFSTVYFLESQRLIVMVTTEEVMQVAGENNPIKSAQYLCPKVWKKNPQLKSLTFVVSLPDGKFEEVNCK